MPLRTTAGTAYDETGPVDAPTAVFLHGLGLDRHLWDGLTPHFADAYRVVRYDLTGHGDTPAPAGDLSLASFADQLLELLDHLGVGRAALVGFSLGGMINRRFALDYPDRTGPLVVLNSPHERDPEAQRLVEERATAVAGGGIGATIDSTLERWFTPGFRNQHPDTVARVRDTVLANDLDPYTRTRWVLAAGVPELVRPDPPITRPALGVTGELDSGSTPAMAHAIAAEIGGASTVIVPGLRHLGLLEDPAAFTIPLRTFLDACPPSAWQDDRP